MSRPTQSLILDPDGVVVAVDGATAVDGLALPRVGDAVPQLLLGGTLFGAGAAALRDGLLEVLQRRRESCELVAEPAAAGRASLQVRFRALEGYHGGAVMTVTEVDPPPLPTATGRPVPAGDDDGAALLAALRQLPGVDPDAGLAAVGGRVAIYRRLLGVFIDSHAAEAERAAELFEAGRPDQARSLAHRLRGSAATLGLTDVERAAALVEHPAPAALPTQWRSDVATLRVALAAAVTGLRSALVHGS